MLNVAYLAPPFFMPFSNSAVTKSTAELATNRELTMAYQGHSPLAMVLLLDLKNGLLCKNVALLQIGRPNRESQK